MSGVAVAFNSEYVFSRMGLDTSKPHFFSTYIVTGVQLPGNRSLDFSHFTPKDYGVPVIRNLTFTEDIAKRIFDFCERTYVNGEGGFDCHGFLAYAMGRTRDVVRGSKWNCYGSYVQPEDTISGLPYLIAQEEDGEPPHSVLGAEQTGRGLSVASTEGPLIIADNADLLKAFGGFALLEVERVEYI